MEQVTSEVHQLCELAVESTGGVQVECLDLAAFFFCSQPSLLIAYSSPATMKGMRVCSGIICYKINSHITVVSDMSHRMSPLAQSDHICLLR